MQNKLDFIIEKAGGDSLAHVLEYFGKNNNYFQLYGGIDYWCKASVEISVNKYNEDYEDFLWQLLINNKEAKLSDQSSECVDALYELMGGGK